MVNLNLILQLLGEVVRKLGERVLPLIIPIFSRGLTDPDANRRQVGHIFNFPFFRHLNWTIIMLFFTFQGVFTGLREVVASASKSQLGHPFVIGLLNI